MYDRTMTVTLLSTSSALLEMETARVIALRQHITITNTSGSRSSASLQFVVFSTAVIIGSFAIAFT